MHLAFRFLAIIKPLRKDLLKQDLAWKDTTRKEV